jgi:hypothetical protein
LFLLLCLSANATLYLKWENKMTEFELLVKAIVKRQMARDGSTHLDAQAFAVGYLSAFVNNNLIERAKPAERKRMQKEILDRLDTVLSSR